MDLKESFVEFILRGRLKIEKIGEVDFIFFVKGEFCLFIRVGLNWCCVGYFGFGWLGLIKGLLVKDLG